MPAETSLIYTLFSITRIVHSIKNVLDIMYEANLEKSNTPSLFFRTREARRVIIIAGTLQLFFPHVFIKKHACGQGALYRSFLLLSRASRPAKAL